MGISTIYGPLYPFLCDISNKFPDYFHLYCVGLLGINTILSKCNRFLLDVLQMVTIYVSRGMLFPNLTVKAVSISDSHFFIYDISVRGTAGSKSLYIVDRLCVGFYSCTNSCSKFVRGLFIGEVCNKSLIYV